MGFAVHRSTGANRTILGVVGTDVQGRPAAGRDVRGRAGSRPDLRAVQAGEPGLQAERHRHRHRGRPHRRRRGRRHGRAVLGRERRAGAGDGGRREARRRQGAARRRVQAAQLAVHLPGPGRRRPADAARRRRRAQPEARVRGDGPVPDRGRRSLRGHLPDRRAQHAELRAAARARPRAQAGAAQARHLGDDRGVAAVGRVRAGRRQHGRHPLRARHPHVRDLHAQHARHLRDPHRQEAEPPARSSWTPATAPGGATRWRRWRGPRSRRAPTA